MKKVISILLTLCMLMALVPTAFAASTPPDFSDGWTALTSADNGKTFNGGNYYLNDDITLEVGITFTGTTVLDLNGHVIKIDSALYSGIATAITVSGENGNPANFTLRDSNPTAKHYFSKQTSGLWKWEPTITEETEGYELVEGGVITGGNGISGGGICVVNYASANLNGGNIVGCLADDGGGIAVIDYSIATFNGVNIIGCVAEVRGGGIYADRNYGNNIIINSAKIISCKAKAGGGISNYCNFTINDVSIKDCIASQLGGGINSAGDKSTFTMNGGEIENCVATQTGGGVYVSYSTFKMTGGSIKNCTSMDSSANACCATEVGTMYADGGVIDGTVNFSRQYCIKRSDDAKATTVFNGKVTYGSTIYTGIFYGGLDSDNSSDIIGNTYTVKFFENDTDTEPFATAFIVGDGTKLVPPTMPEREGYTLVWYTEDGDEYTFDSVVDSDFSLYANYTHTNHADSDGDGLCDVCDEVMQPAEPTTEKTLADYILNLIYEAIRAILRILSGRI